MSYFKKENRIYKYVFNNDIKVNVERIYKNHRNIDFSSIVDQIGNREGKGMTTSMKAKLNKLKNPELT